MFCFDGYTREIKNILKHPTRDSMPPQKFAPSMDFVCAIKSGQKCLRSLHSFDINHIFKIKRYIGWTVCTWIRTKFQVNYPNIIYKVDSAFWPNVKCGCLFPISFDSFTATPISGNIAISAMIGIMALLSALKNIPLLI